MSEVGARRNVPHMQSFFTHYTVTYKAADTTCTGPVVSDVTMFKAGVRNYIVVMTERSHNVTSAIAVTVPARINGIITIMRAP